ncbi:MAG: hypothetical protein AAGB18_09140 [Pseudomonadota bacterium]
MSALPQQALEEELEKRRASGAANLDELAALEQELSGRDPEAMRASWMQQGAEMARLETSAVVSELLSRSNMSLRSIQEAHGFAPATLSRWKRGTQESGAELASVKALAAALGLRVRLVIEDAD